MAKKQLFLPPMVKARARRLRHDSTCPERLLWSRLRGGRLAGLKFRRQHSIGSFIIDFYCHDALLAIELDGATHDGRCDYDNSRTAVIAREGIRVLRFHNDDVIHDLEAVLTAVLLACGVDPKSPSPSGRGPG